MATNDRPCSHIEYAADGSTAALDAALAGVLATVIVVGRQAGQGCNLASVQLTRLWQISQQTGNSHRTDARDGAQLLNQLVVGSLSCRLDRTVQSSDLLVQLGDVRLQAFLDHAGACKGQATALIIAQLHYLLSPPHQLL